MQIDRERTEGGPRASRKKRPSSQIRVMFLETQLDRAFTSRRSEIPFMREFLQNFEGVELIAKEVHSRADLEKFLDEARRHPVRVLHIVAHGSRVGGSACIVLTGDEFIDLNSWHNRHLFAGVKASAIFLSCCVIGSDAGILSKLVEESGAEAVFTYRYSVEDYQAFLVEALFYHLLYGSHGNAAPAPFDEVYARLVFALDYFGIDQRPRALVDPLLVAVFRRDD
jgi:hypothetical protein